MFVVPPVVEKLLIKSFTPGEVHGGPYVGIQYCALAPKEKVSNAATSNFFSVFITFYYDRLFL
jgi:hypothetical protein